ncbi:hypothetical protein [Halobacillus salinus]|uniref:hypothetical protein n=1 Tax=Halobacillus salinus TaxID=192814 RepID=UPI0009A8ADA9|nr:hypothetical protein [Halobacillus salinus]
MNPSVSSLGKLASTQSALTKSGQVIKGEVLELKPGNRAVVLVGKQKIQAKLETPLTKGKSYVFQVMSEEGGATKLRVVSETKGIAERLDLQQLLKGLSLKSTKLNKDFLQSLLKTNVSFQTQDLRQALTLLQQAENKAAAKDVLLQLMQKKYPVKPAVYQALLSKKTTELTQLLKQFTTSESPQTSNDQRVQKLVASLKGVSSAVSSLESSVAKILTEVSKDQKTSFQLFQKAGIIQHKQSFTQYQREWNQWASHESLDAKTSSQGMKSLSFKEILHLIQSPNTTPPIPASLDQMAQDMKRLFDLQLPLTKTEHQALNRWTSNLEKLGSSTDTRQAGISLFTDSAKHKWSADHQLLHKNQSFQKLLPHLTESERSAFEHVTRQLPKLLDHQLAMNQPPREVVQALRNIQSMQLTQVQKASLTDWISMLSDHLSPSVKDSMLIKLKSMLHLSGIQDESMMKQAVLNDEPPIREGSLKSALLQSMQDPHTQIRPELARQMVSLVNGIQLSVHQETTQTIQMALQFPGDLVGATEDIQMNMEGRKTEKGEIDPAYCHIVFFLQLENFEATVIDMSIINRRVGVTVYNHHEIDPVVEEFKPMLKDGLTALGYQLSSLQRKPLQNEMSKRHSTQGDRRQEDGVDLRI